MYKVEYFLLAWKLQIGVSPSPTLRHLSTTSNVLSFQSQALGGTANFPVGVNSFHIPEKGNNGKDGGGVPKYQLSVERKRKCRFLSLFWGLVGILLCKVLLTPASFEGLPHNFAHILPFFYYRTQGNSTGLLRGFSSRHKTQACLAPAKCSPITFRDLMKILSALLFWCWSALGTTTTSFTCIFRKNGCSDF